MTRFIDASPRLKRKELPIVDPALDYRPAVPSLLGQTDMLLLYCAVTAHMPDEPSRIIELTSATPGEGTSTIAREMALTIAGDLSKSVMLIRVVNDLPLSPGLEAVAHGRIPLEAVLETDLYVPTLTTATLSLGGGNAGLLFDGDELDRVFAQAARLARLVIIDAPPILSDVTGIALSRKVSGVLLIVEAERTRAPIIEQARRVIETGGGRVLGVILNKRKHHIPGWLYRRL
jgi:Mrp family chromosome partitioning ATPase